MDLHQINHIPKALVRCPTKQLGVGVKVKNKSTRSNDKCNRW
jgi:hypothetical protein